MRITLDQNPGACPRPRASVTSASATAIAASAAAIAATGVDRIAGTIRRGVVAAEPAGDAPTTFAAVITAAVDGVVAGPPALSLAVLQSRHQRVANQRGAADCNSQCRHRVRHRIFSAETAQRRRIVHCKKIPRLPLFVAKCGGLVH